MSLTVHDQAAAGTPSTDRSYPITTPVAYRLRNGERALMTGSGRTKSISTSTVLLESEVLLPIGMVVELDITWPIRVDNRVEMDLHVLGRTIRADGNFTTISILRHEFRSRSEAVTRSQADASNSSRTMTASAS